jgi:hypothetical protein
VLIDVSATAREARFKYPVALAAAVWARCVAAGGPGAKVCSRAETWLSFTASLGPGMRSAGRKRLVVILITRVSD